MVIRVLNILCEQKNCTGICTGNTVARNHKNGWSSALHWSIRPFIKKAQRAVVCKLITTKAVTVQQSEMLNVYTHLQTIWNRLTTWSMIMSNCTFSLWVVKHNLNFTLHTDKKPCIFILKYDSEKDVTECLYLFVHSEFIKAAKTTHQARR